ncbi:MAG: TonB-dependent receptor [bacterium]|nr:TonB-dependent receptor [bacterium]
MKRHFNFCLFVVLAIIGLVGNTNAKPDTTATTTLREITVTAERQPTTLLEAPYSVNVIGVRQQSNAISAGLDKALSEVPGVFAQSRYGGSDVRLTIRGFGSRGAAERSNAATIRGVRVLLDGIPLTEPDGRTSLDLVELSTLQKIEVVRTNASTLWGNASGGVLHLQSSTGSGSPAVSIEQDVGAHGYQRSTISGEGSYAGKQYSAVVYRSRYDGWRDHSDGDRTGFRASMAGNLSQTAQYGFSLAGVENSFKIPGALTEAQVSENPTLANATYQRRDERRINKLGLAGGWLIAELPGNHALEIRAFYNPKRLERSERNTYRDFDRVLWGGDAVLQRKFQHTESLSFTAAMGVDFSSQSGIGEFRNLVDGQRGTVTSDKKDEIVRNYGMFLTGNLQWRQWRGTIGFRNDWVDYDFHDMLHPALDDAKQFSVWSPRLAVSWLPRVDQSLYLQYSGGIEVPAGNEVNPPPGWDTLTILNPNLEPMRSRTLEAGWKIFGAGEKWLSRWSSEIAVYRITVSDELIPYDNGKYYASKASSERYGVEWSGVCAFSQGISTRAALTWQQHRYREYQAIDGAESFAENRVAGVPDWFYSLSAEYRPILLSQLSLSAKVRGVGDYYADDANRLKIDSYQLVDAGIVWKQPVSKELSLRFTTMVENLADRKYIASTYINPEIPTTAQPAYLEPGLPRNYTVALALEWKK